MITRNLRAAAACALLSTTALAAPALAQAVPSPTFRQTDENGVDLVQGTASTSIVEGSIGSGQAELKLIRRIGFASGTQWDRIRLTLSASGNYVDFGTHSDKFPGAEARGATLTGSGSTYQYTSPDGTVIAFENTLAGSNDETTSNLCMAGSSDCFLVPTSITQPDGEAVTLEYDYWTHCFAQTPAGQPRSPDDPIHCDYVPRLKSVTNNFGYKIVFAYADARTGGSGNPPTSWYQRSGASFYNNAVSPTSPQASVSYAYPLANVTDITDMGGRVWRVTDSGTLLAIRRPGATADTTSYTVSGGVTSSVTNEGVTKTYSRSIAGNTVTLTITDPLSHNKVITSDLTVGRPSSIQDELGRITSYQYDTNGRPTRMTMPEGNYTQLTYDARGNVTETRNVAKSGSGLADIVTTAGFDSSCSNVKTCNQPNWTKDAKLNQTDYTYDGTHGGVLTITQPAATSGGVRPQVRNSYTLTNGVYLLTGISACQTGSNDTNPTCVGTADEVKSTIGYDGNGNVTSTSQGNGAGTLTATSTMTYNAVGDMETVDGPLAGSADTTRYRYDSARELIGVVDADPDGAGPLKMRALRLLYTSSGLLKTRQIGTVTDQSDAAWNNFAFAYQLDSQFDGNDRVVRQTLWDGTANQGITDTIYDGVGRPSCSITYMDMARWHSPYATTCAPFQTNGSFGPDRVSKTTFDAAGEVTELRVGVGTADETADRTMSYSNNGKLLTLKDGENNLTTYEYDGFDRTAKTRFPDTTKGSGTSSATDYELASYDANSNTVSRRLRDGQVIGLGYDNLNRATSKDLPGSETDETFAYDLLGRMTGAQKGVIPHSFTYDALGRQVAEGQLYGAVSRQFDLAGHMTRLTWWDGFYVDYDRLPTGEISRVRENGATSGPGVLASFYYDDLRRRTSKVYGYGAVTYYAYDSVSRLWAQTNDFDNNAYDLNIGSITYNPANQIVSEVRSNDLYATVAPTSGSASSTSNGLNQLTASGGSSLTYDARGNATVVPGTSCTSALPCTYGSQNEFKGNQSLWFAYDALLRPADQSVNWSVTKQFTYNGSQIVAVSTPGTGLTERYVWGDGPDELLVAYDGSSGTSRHFIQTDQRGSVIASSDSAGAVSSTNKYDEYGVPASTNAGRFQYTGQMWVPEAGIYHYKARAYAPGPGVFVQTDPIGAVDSPNLYSYVLNDPVNSRDPTGKLVCDGPNCVEVETITVTGSRHYYQDTHCDVMFAVGCGGLGDPLTAIPPGLARPGGPGGTAPHPAPPPAAPASPPPPTPTPNPLSYCTYFSSSTYSAWGASEAFIASLLPGPLARVVAIVAAKDQFMAEVCR